jgi:hypothetical protein
MTPTEQGGWRAAKPISPLAAGLVIDIRLPTFTPRVTILSESELTVEVIAGAHIGFSDTVEYEAVALRDDLVMLSWKEHNGSTIVHALDLGSCITYVAVTPATGEFLRMTGPIEMKSGT